MGNSSCAAREKPRDREEAHAREPTTESWKTLKPIENARKPDALTEVYLGIGAAYAGSLFR
ncbi:hypothetical protein [Actinomadura sp. 21ATH]|uniref:hypothetical protein n=1 Tax=Actinomadura sp. 21ATH TaxID=1735444 RepID=UPI0035C11C9F